MATPMFDRDWDGGSKTRVLVTARECGDRGVIASVLRHAGYSTAGCAGPDGHRERCPLVIGEECHAAEEADVIVCALPTSQPEAREVLVRLRQRFPGRPLVLERSSIAGDEDPSAWEGCIFIEPDLGAASVLEAVAQAEALVDP